MIDLRQKCGLGIDIWLDEEALGLDFDPALVDGRGGRHSLSERPLQAIRPVLMEEDAAGPGILYRMYRNMGRSKHGRRELASIAHLRYDITVLRNGMLGKELLKTFGHFHPPTCGALHLSCPEAYEVIHGTVWFLLQKVEKATDIYEPAGHVRITDVILAEVHEGEHVIMPPNYGHVMINPTGSVSVTSDWVCSDFDSDYIPYERHRGAAWYVLPPKGGGKPEYKVNSKWGEPPEPRWARPVQKVPELGLYAGVPLFCAFYREPERFRYLCKPHEATEALAVEGLFRFE